MGSPAGQNNFTRFTVDEFGIIGGAMPQNTTAVALQMRAEVATRGPIACSICVTEELENWGGKNATDHVFHDKSGCTAHMHVIAVSGYGTHPTDGDYWVVRNSWGTYWGAAGWFKLARGINNLGLEERCVWAVPSKVEWA